MEYSSIPFSGSITLKFFNPLFNDRGGYSLPVSFNGNIADIKRALGYPDVKEAEVKPYLPGRIKSQFLDFIGSWQIEEAGNAISASFKTGSGDFYSAIQDKLLSDIDFGGAKYPLGHGVGWSAILAHLDTKMDVSYPESEYSAYCAYMPNAVNVENATDITFVNEVTVPESGPMGFKNQFGNTAAYLFVGTVIDYLFNSMGYKIEYNYFRKHPGLQHLTIFNTFNLRPPASSEYYNQARIDYKDLVPHISCGDFLKAIRNRFNIGFFINEQKKSVKIVPFDKIISEGVKQVCSSRPKFPTVKNNRLPGILFPLNEPDEWSKHAYKSEAELKNAITVTSFRDILPETRSGGTVLYVEQEHAYYRVKFEEPSTYEAERISSDQFPYFEGTTPQEMTQLSGIPSLCTKTINREFIYWEGTNRIVGHTDVDYIVPRCDLVGNGYGQPFTDFPLMFLFSRGISNGDVQMPDPNDPIQEYATITAFPPIGTKGIKYLAIDTGNFYRWSGTAYVEVISEPEELPVFEYPLGHIVTSDATMTLRWGGDYGLIKLFWSNRINWELNIKKLIKAELLSDDIPKLIDFDEVKRIGDDNYIVNSFEINVEGNKETLKNVEVFRL